MGGMERVMVSVGNWVVGWMVVMVVSTLPVQSVYASVCVYTV